MQVISILKRYWISVAVLSLLLVGCGLFQDPPDRLPESRPASGQDAMEEEAPEASSNDLEPPEGSAPMPDSPLMQQQRREMLALVPYQPPRMINPAPDPLIPQYYFHDTPEGRMLANYLLYVTAPANVPAASFSSLHELDEGLVLAVALCNNQAYSPELRQQQYPAVPELLPYITTAYYTSPALGIQLLEHVEETAEFIFGKGASVVHRPAATWNYIPHQYYVEYESFGLVRHVIPVVLDYEESANYYTVTACFLQRGDGEEIVPYRLKESAYASEGLLIGPRDIPAHLQEEALRYVFTLRKAGSTLLYTGCEAPE